MMFSLRLHRLARLAADRTTEIATNDPHMPKIDGRWGRNTVTALQRMKGSPGRSPTTRSAKRAPHSAVKTPEQKAETGDALFVLRNGFGVKHDPVHRQCGERRCKRRKMLRPIVPATGEQQCTALREMCLHPVAVELDLRHPAGATGTTQLPLAFQSAALRSPGSTPGRYQVFELGQILLPECNCRRESSADILVARLWTNHNLPQGLLLPHHRIACRAAKYHAPRRTE
jgi:hypothetical protein